jgi:hypothetical protein
LKENPPCDTAFPGPAQYNPKPKIFEKNSDVAFSMRPKTANGSAFQNPTKGVPGPGTYNLKNATESNNGYCVSSRY